MELFLHNKISEEQALWWNLYSVTHSPPPPFFSFKNTNDQESIKTW